MSEDYGERMSQLDEASLVWIERQVARTRFSVWRTRAGFHYEAQTPHDGWDEEVMYRFDTVVSGVVRGAYPEFGETWTVSASEPPMTRITLPVEHGPWIDRRADDTRTGGSVTE